MQIFWVLLLLVVAWLLLPDAFAALGRGIVENPQWGIVFLAPIALILSVSPQGSWTVV